MDDVQAGVKTQQFIQDSAHYSATCLGASAAPDQSNFYLPLLNRELEFYSHRSWPSACKRYYEDRNAGQRSMPGFNTVEKEQGA